MRRIWRLLGWFVVVYGLIAIFGATTAPLLLSLAADLTLGLLIIRSLLETPAAMSAPETGTLRGFRRIARKTPTPLPLPHWSTGAKNHLYNKRGL